MKLIYQSKVIITVYISKKIHNMKKIKLVTKLIQKYQNQKIKNQIIIQII